MKKAMLGEIPAMQEIPETSGSDFSGTPLNRSNYLVLKSMLRNVRGVYDLYGYYRSFGIGYLESELTDKGRNKIYGILRDIWDYPLLAEAEEVMDSLEVRAASHQIWEVSSGFRKLFRSNKVPFTGDNISNLAHWCALNMEWSSPWKLDYSEDTQIEVFSAWKDCRGL